MCFVVICDYVWCCAMMCGVVWCSENMCGVVCVWCFVMVCMLCGVVCGM